MVCRLFLVLVREVGKCGAGLMEVGRGVIEVWGGNVGPRTLAWLLYSLLAVFYLGTLLLLFCLRR